MRVPQFILVVLGVALSYPMCEANSQDWPVVAPVSKSFDFPDASKAAVSITLSSREGKPLYLLECLPFGYDGDRDFDYSGDFECRLKSLYSKDRYSTLLTDTQDQSRDWQSRGRFLVEELAGRCADYPEYGRMRNFDLRGMRITLEMNGFVLRATDTASRKVVEKSRFESFRFKVTVKSKRDTRTPIAAPVKYLPPPFVDSSDQKNTARNCDQVLAR